MSGFPIFRRLVVALLAGVLTACGGGDDGSGPAPLPAPPAPAAGTVGDGRLSELIEWARASQQAPAMGAIVIRNGQVAESAAVGLRSADGGPSVTTADQWHMGSITKSMTATLEAHLDGERGTPGLLTAESYATLHTPVASGYALGWAVDSSLPPLGAAGFTHNGSNLRWFAVNWFSPEKNCGLLVVVNGGGDRGFAAMSGLDTLLRARIAASP